MSTPLENNYILYIKTIQSNIIRILFESLKDILHDVNLIFNKKGIKIKAKDENNVSFVYLKLSAEKFKEGGEFYCSTNDNKYIGVDLILLNKLIKSVNTGDVLTLYIENDSPDKLGIKVENSEKNSITNFTMNLLDIDEENISMPEFQYNLTFTMPSQEFQKLCRDLIIIGDEVIIESIDDKIIFRCESTFASRETIFNSGQYNSDELENIENKSIFSLKYLNFFTKATNLCNNVNILFKQDTPLIIEYSVGSLGNLKFCLAPKTNLED